MVKCRTVLIRYHTLTLQYCRTVLGDSRDPRVGTNEDGPGAEKHKENHDTLYWALGANTFKERVNERANIACRRIRLIPLSSNYDGCMLQELKYKEHRYEDTGVVDTAGFARVQDSPCFHVYFKPPRMGSSRPLTGLPRHMNKQVH